MDDPSAGAGDLSAERYEDRGQIAVGGMATVRALWDALLGRPLAVKELKGDPTGDSQARFVAEARITGGLDHPNVLPIYDLCFDPADGTPRLLMKLVEGQTLASLLQEATEPPSGMRLEGLLEVVLKVCDALSFAHSRGVIHRDLHPQNVMVGSHGQVYVMDWGLAVKRDELVPRAPVPSGATFGSGTPAYMSPEQAWGRTEEIDERTDVFGIGVILYEMLTLRAPFEPTGYGDAITLARQCRVVPPDEVVPASSPPARLCAIVMKALAEAREHRYQTVQALRDDVGRFLRSGGWLAAQRFQSGSLIIEEGEVGDRAYIISEGTCEVFRAVGDRIERLRVVGPGGVVGEVGLFTGARRVASVRAMTDVTALVVTRDALERELERAGLMRSFVEAGIARFAELDEIRRRA
jgi:eukaryotic-like serine/threonine-protein kinase